jgi:hypothetical protein
MPVRRGSRQRYRSLRASGSRGLRLRVPWCLACCYIAGRSLRHSWGAGRAVGRCERIGCGSAAAAARIRTRCSRSGKSPGSRSVLGTRHDLPGKAALGKSTTRAGHESRAPKKAVACPRSMCRYCAVTRRNWTEPHGIRRHATGRPFAVISRAKRAKFAFRKGLSRHQGEGFDSRQLQELGTLRRRFRGACFLARSLK